MPIAASATSLPRLFGGPVVVLDRPPPPGNRPFAVCWLDDSGRLLSSEHDQDPAMPLDVLPLGCIALVAFTAEGAERLGSLRAHWRETAPASAPPFVDLSAKCPDAGPVLALIEAWAGRLQQVMHEATGLTRQIVALREQAERLQCTQRELTERGKGTACVFYGAAGGVAARCTRLRQRLPVTARGLAAVELYFQSSGGARGEIEIELWRLEEDELLARFAIPSAGADGWRRFVLGEAADCAQGTLELRVHTPQGARVALTAARPGISEPAYAEGKDPLAAPLALRLYAGVPGRPVALMDEATPDAGRLAARIAALESELAAAQARHDKRIAAIAGSTSWRLTAPLRAIKQAMHGRKGRGTRSNG